MNDEQDDESLVWATDSHVGLNMNHPFNQALVQFHKTAPKAVVDAFWARFHRRCAYERAMESIGALTDYRRGLVTRSLVRMFRVGFNAGFRQGFSKGQEVLDGR